MNDRFWPERNVAVEAIEKAGRVVEIASEVVADAR
jgi:hypothetical protein